MPVLSVVSSFNSVALLELAIKQWGFLISLGKLLNHPKSDFYATAMEEEAERTRNRATSFVNRRGIQFPQED
jgi:hypothetical protein